MSYEFSMPWPPSVNAWKTPFKNRMILTKRGRQYRKDALDYLQNQGLTGENVSERLTVHLTLNPPTARKYDIDNFCKSVFDALTHSGFWLDDEQVYRMVVEKGVKTSGGNVGLKVVKHDKNTN